MTTAALDVYLWMRADSYVPVWHVSQLLTVQLLTVLMYNACTAAVPHAAADGAVWFGVFEDSTVPVYYVVLEDSTDRGCCAETWW